MPRKTTLAALLACSLVPAGFALADVAAGGLTPTSLYLRAGTVDAATPRTAATLAAEIGAHAPQARYMIQLDGPMTPERRARLAAAGIPAGAYFPANAYLVTLDKADVAAVGALEFIRWWSPYLAAWKLDPEIGRRPYLTPERQALAKQGRDLLTVVAFQGADTGEVARAIFAIRGAEVLEEQAIAGHVEMTVRMRLADAPRLAAIPGIQFVEPSPEITDRSNLNTRWIVQSNVSGSFPLYDNGLRGEGQVVGILDGRVDINHCSFSDPLNPVGPTHRKVVRLASTGAGDSHGTHCAGTAVGDGGAEDNTRGVAYLGKLAWGPSGGTSFFAQTDANHAAGARIHTNSWGNDGTTAYDALCRAIDDFTWQNEDDVICFAVTNQTLLKNPENAKNVLAVGNTKNSPDQTAVCTGGAGPTADGRRKPEIFAPGHATLSSSSGTSCGTVAFTGTSMASPAIAGTAMLVRQYFVNGYYPTGVPGGLSHNPSGALVRAALMNSGQDITAAHNTPSPCNAVASPAGYPSNLEGWGRVKADDALYFPGDARKLLMADVRNGDGLSTAGEHIVNVNVLGSGQPLRITLSWTEPPAAAGAGNPVINDLDLVVEGPGGMYLGNVFNTATGESTSGGVKDAKNSTEQVHLLAPPPGPYTVRIRGGAVGVGAQGFAVVATGDIQGGTPPPLIVSASGIPALVAPGDPYSVNVTVTPGSQNVVAGSPTAWHRSTISGTFIPTPLVSLGGTAYRADFPAALCAHTPQFYFTAQGDQGATAAAPGNAPASSFSTAIGTITTSTLFTESFESGLPAGWSVTGLWNISGSCPPGGSCDGPTWAYYGQPAVCTYATGTTANSGDLTSAPIALPTLPPGGSITLSYCSAKVSENLSGWDITTLAVNGTTVDTTGDSPSFETRTVNLTSYAGQTVTLRWRFATGDGQFNTFRGWHVDNVRIEATTTGCTDPGPACYPNCDGSTAAPVLNVADFGCFLTRYAAGEAYANCDESTAPPILNVADFGCFLTRYAAGCP
ncbi:MAG: S8 family serine peptidase [Phycisphaerales bacterium]